MHNQIQKLIAQLHEERPTVGEIAESQYKLLQETHATKQAYLDFLEDLKIAVMWGAKVIILIFTLILLGVGTFATWAMAHGERDNSKKRHH